MTGARDWGDVVFLIFVLAMIVILVRPSSLAPTIVTAVGDGFAGIIAFVADAGGAAPATEAREGIGALVKKT